MAQSATLRPATALVVRNYHCRESTRFAYWLQERFDTERYGHVIVDPNEGFPEAGDQWYAAYKALTARGVYIIALVTTALSDAPDEEDESFKGVALLSELLHFWDGAMRDDEPPNSGLLTLSFWTATWMRYVGRMASTSNCRILQCRC